MSSLVLSAETRLADIGVIPTVVGDYRWDMDWEDDDSRDGDDEPVFVPSKTGIGEYDGRRRIAKVILSGSPCAGKTASVPFLVDALREAGWTVLMVPENASLSFEGGAHPHVFVDRATYQARLATMACALEDFFMSYAREQLPGVDVVVLCDRGAVDSYSFIPRKDWARFESCSGLDREELLSRYDLVALMESSSAAGYHDAGGGSARTETAEESIKLDDLTSDAWDGHPNILRIPSRASFGDKVDDLIAQVLGALGEPANGAGN